MCKLPIKLFIFLASFLAATLYADRPVIELTGYENITDFTGVKAVLIRKGDDPAFKDPGLDDSAWGIVSFPFNWIKLYPDYTGICWYRIHLRFPDRLPDKILGVDLGVISDSDQAFFNGDPVAGSGKIPPEREHSYDRHRIYEIPTHLIRKNADNLLAIRVIGLFPGEGGAIKGKLKFGPFRQLQNDFFKSELLIIIFIVIYMAIAVYFTLIFSRRTISKEYIIFPVFIVVTSLYIFLRSQVKYFISDDFLLLKRMEYITLILMLPLMMEYITFYFRRRHSVFHYLYLAVSAVSLVMILIFSDPVIWNNFLIYLIEPSWIMPILLCLYIAFRERRNEPDAKYILISFIIVWILFINDVLIERLVYNFHYLANYGFLIVIIGTSIIMRRRLSRLSSEVEEYRLRKERKPEITEETRKKFGKALDYLEENYMFNIARENLAGLIGLNPDYLGKLFIQQTGMKMNDYINELRIKEASGLLAESDANVTDIAFKVGFESLATFYRVFQKHRKMQPNIYREKYKTNKGLI